MDKVLTNYKHYLKIGEFIFIHHTNHTIEPLIIYFRCHL